MKKILVAGLLFFFLELLADDTVTTAPGEITVAINPQKIPNHPMAPAQYRKPTDYTPKLYKYNLKQISDIFSKDLIHKAQNQMRRIESVNKNGKWKPDGKSLDLHECLPFLGLPQLLCKKLGRRLPARLFYSSFPGEKF